MKNSFGGSAYPSLVKDDHCSGSYSCFRSYSCFQLQFQPPVPVPANYTCGFVDSTTIDINVFAYTAKVPLASPLARPLCGAPDSASTNFVSSVFASSTVSSSSSSIIDINVFAHSSRSALGPTSLWCQQQQQQQQQQYKSSESSTVSHSTVSHKQ